MKINHIDLCSNLDELISYVRPLAPTWPARNLKEHYDATAMISIQQEVQLTIYKGDCVILLKNSHTATMLQK